MEDRKKFWSESDKPVLDDFVELTPTGNYIVWFYYPHTYHMPHYYAGISPPGWDGPALNIIGNEKKSDLEHVINAVIGVLNGIDSEREAGSPKIIEKRIREWYSEIEKYIAEEDKKTENGMRVVNTIYIIL